VAAPNGLKLRAGGALELQGERVTLASGESSLELAPGALSLKAKSLKAKVGRTRWTGRSVTAKA